MIKKVANNAITSTSTSSSSFSGDKKTSRHFTNLSCNKKINFDEYTKREREIIEFIKLDHNYALPISQHPLITFQNGKLNPTRFLLSIVEDAKERGARGSDNNNFNKVKTISKLETLLKRGSSALTNYQNLHGSPSSSLNNSNNSNSSPSPSPSSANAFFQSPTSNSSKYFIKEDSNSTNTDEEEIDVLSETSQPKIPATYDDAKARGLMNECFKHVNFLKTVDAPDNWEEQIVKTGWTKTQRFLFKQVIKALHSEHLARLTFVNNPIEPVLRRSSIDRISQKIRQTLTKVAWDSKLTQWLHGALVDNLNYEYLSYYLDVLQTLRVKAPALVDKMIILSTSTATPNANQPSTSTSSLSTDPNPQSSSSSDSTKEAMKKLLNSEAISLLLKRQWDPYLPLLNQKQLKKLPSNPIFLIVPSGPSFSSTLNPKRVKNITSLLSHLGKVVTVSLNQQGSSSLTIFEYTNKMLSVTRSKINEIRNSEMNRPIFLIGWGPGALVAGRLSSEESVIGVIALAFPIVGYTKSNGNGDDILLSMQKPILFIIGERATNNSPAKMEAFRKNLQCENSLMVINAANECLTVNRCFREKLLITQTYVDREIVEEIIKFVNKVELTSRARLLHCKEYDNLKMVDKSQEKKKQTKRKKINNEANSNSNKKLNPNKKTKVNNNKNLSPEEKRTLILMKNVNGNLKSLDPCILLTKLPDNNPHSKTNNISTQPSSSISNNSGQKPINSIINRNYNKSGKNAERNKNKDKNKDLQSNNIINSEYNFDCPKMIPSNITSTKRKTFYKPAPPQQQQQPQPQQLISLLKLAPNSSPSSSNLSTVNNTNSTSPGGGLNNTNNSLGSPTTTTSTTASPSLLASPLASPIKQQISTPNLNSNNHTSTSSLPLPALTPILPPPQKTTHYIICNNVNSINNISNNSNNNNCNNITNNNNTNFSSSSSASSTPISTAVPVSKSLLLDSNSSVPPSPLASFSNNCFTASQLIQQNTNYFTASQLLKQKKEREKMEEDSVTEDGANAEGEKGEDGKINSNSNNAKQPLSNKNKRPSNSTSNNTSPTSGVNEFPPPSKKPNMIFA